MSDEIVLRRLKRLEQQVRAFRDLHVSEVSELARKLTAISQLQADELQLILGELEAIVSEAEAATSAASDPAASDPAAMDPAAASPKRAKWLAEQERRSPISRRELLRGRGERGPDAPGG